MGLLGSIIISKTFPFLHCVSLFSFAVMTTLYCIAIERESKLLSSAASVFIVMKIITTTKRMKRKPSCCDNNPHFNMGYTY